MACGGVGCGRGGGGGRPPAMRPGMGSPPPSPVQHPRARFAFPAQTPPPRTPMRPSINDQNTLLNSPSPQSRRGAMGPGFSPQGSTPRSLSRPPYVSPGYPQTPQTINDTSEPSFYSSSSSPSPRVRRTTSTTIITEEEDEEDDEDSYSGPGGGRFDQTFDVSGPSSYAPNSTYSVPANSTYNVPGNATYNVPSNTTYNVAPNAMYNPNATYNVPGNATYNVPANATYNVSSDLPPEFYAGDVSGDGPYEESDPLALYSTFNIQPHSFEVGPQRPPVTVGPGVCPAAAGGGGGGVGSPGGPGGHGPGGPHHNRTYSRRVTQRTVTESPSTDGRSLNESGFNRGIQQQPQSSPQRPASSVNLTSEVQRHLTELENTERDQINRDLEQFHRARRQLVEDTTTISSNSPNANFATSSGQPTF